MKWPVIVLFLAFTAWSCSNKQYRAEEQLDPENSNSTIIAFGSCNKSFIDQNMWPAITQNQPDIFVWLGDIIYGDTHDMQELTKAYQAQKTNNLYQEFISECPVIGVWDDHDYGINDGGKYFSKKKESKEVLLEFLDTPADDPIRTHEGVYSSYNLAKGNNKVKIILLDARYFRDTLVHSTEEGRRYEPNPDGDILGEEQWTWLEKELTNSDAQIHVIGSGIQFLPEEHGFEKWANFPTARTRFIELLKKTNPSRPILISGDRHIAEISRINLDSTDNNPLYEVTSSGLTHTWSTIWEEPNQYRIGNLIVARNFGLIKIDWSEEPVSIDLEIRGLADSLYYSQKVVL